MKFLDLKEYTWDLDIDKEDMKYIFPNIHEPIIIRDYCKNTFAYKKWNPEHIAELFGDKKLGIDTYSDEANGHWQQLGDKSTMKQYIEYLKKVDIPKHYIGEFTLNGPEIDSNVVDEDLFDKLHMELINNNYVNHHTYDKTVMYFGKNACTECHIHFVDNYIVNQIFGTKTFYFFDYNDNNHIVNKMNLKQLFNIEHSESGPGYVSYNKDDGTTTKTFMDLNFDKFNKLYKVTLNPGDAVLIPPWWWHTTQGHDINCTVVNGFKRKNLAYLFKMPDLFLIVYILFGTQIFQDNFKNVIILFSIILCLCYQTYKRYPYTFVKELPFYILFFLVVIPYINTPGLFFT